MLAAMKQQLLLTLLATSPLLAAGQTPITLTQANFPVGGPTTERTQAVAPATVALPQRGANRSWDYSSLLPRIGTTPVTRQYLASANAALPGATRYYEARLNFGAAFTLSSNQHEGATASGWHYYGVEVPYQRHSLTTTTGGANDSITFPRQTHAITPRPSLLAFPASYPQHFTNAFYRLVTDYRLKVAAFGLNNVPGQYVQRITSQADSVVGWGTLRLPTAPNTRVQVLLVRRETTEVDSIYLGGAPAQPILLGAFGFTQGQTFRLVEWAFYRETSAQPLLTIYETPSSGQVTGAFYSLEAIGLSNRAAAGRLTALAVAPQPVAEALTVQAGGLQGEELQAEVHDLAGRRVAAAPLTVGTGSTLLQGLPGGLYLLRLRSRQGEETLLRVEKQ